MTKILNQPIRYTIFILLVLGAGFGLLFLHARTTTSSEPIQQNTNSLIAGQRADGALHSGSLTIPVVISSTPAAQQQGLSGTASLPANSGMLFAFATPSTYGFWMKDMNYPLDFVWIGSNMKIVDITPTVAANTYPKIFYPSQPVSYVLEVNAGFSTIHHLTVGEQLSLQS